ncbi:glutathione S-transferase family protein [Sorangium sp. So ce381]|uniref:glutathione S-transferase family protein n=1 Tax=Sorangium sp. So ce381 TaxID=3133307 RepID=UPI003F5B5F37
MAIVLYHHPFSRAANTVWMLEEVGAEYELKFVDIMAGDQKKEDVTKLNPMGKLPLLVDGDTVVTESAAIGLYLADRYAPGRLAPKLDDAARGTYFRWSLFAPSVIEPGSMAKAGNWEFRAGAAGWGNYDDMIATMESAISGRDFVLGKEFSMADVIFGGTIAYMLDFKMLEPRPSFTGYAERVKARPAYAKSEARNKAVMDERGLKMPGA